MSLFEICMKWYKSSFAFQIKYSDESIWNLYEMIDVFKVLLGEISNKNKKKHTINMHNHTKTVWKSSKLLF